MPREVIDIRHFTTGIVTNVDEKDLPLDAAYTDLDVDPTAREGILAGRADDEGAAVDYHAKQAVLVQQKDGTHDIVYNDVRNGVLGYQTDFYKGRGGDNSASDAPVELSGAADTDLVAMVQHNGVVRVGKGGNAAAKPQWIGRIDDTTFRGKYEDEYVMTDAELTNLVGLPSWYKVLIYTGYWIGVSRYGDRVYKVDSSTGAVTVSPVEHRFAKIDAICAEETTGAHTHIWVGETIGDDYYLKRVNLSTLEVNTVIALTNAYSEDRSSEEYRFSDILHHLDSAKIFLAQTPLEPNKEIKLYSVPYTLTSGSATMTDMSRNICGRVDNWDTPGRFIQQRSTVLVRPVIPVAAPIVNPICLGLLKENHVGLTAYLKCYNDIDNADPEPIVPATYYGVGGYRVHANCFMFVIDPADTDPTHLWPVVSFGTRSTYPLNILTARGDASTDYHLFWWRNNSGVGQTARQSITVSYHDMEYSGSPEVRYNGGYGFPGSTSYIPTGETNIVHTNQSNFVTVNGPNAYYQLHADFSNNLLVLREGNGVEISFAEFGNNIFEKVEDAKDVYYGIALEYDSQQLSPIWTGFTPQQNKQKGLRLTITLTNLSLINPRVNAIVLYRAFGASNSTGPEEFFRRWERVEADDVRWDRTVSGEATIILDDDYSETGASYEAATGVSEALESSMVHYGLACVANGYMVVGRCYHPDVPDASRMLFRSKAQRFDTFNWATDFVALPSPPTALAVYAGRIWAFDKTRAYRVNVEGMFIEDVVEGVGVNDQRCVVETPEGIYAVNSIGLYRLQGQGKVEVSYPVSDMWDTIQNPVLAADESMDTIYVFTTVDGNTRMLVYSRAMNRWDIWSVASDAEQFFSGVFTGKDGEVYYTAYTDADLNMQYEICGSATQKSWEWYSREFAFAGQPFKVYRVIVDGTPVPHITTDRTIDKEILGDGTLEADDRKVYKFEFRLHGLGIEEVRSVSVIMRRMVGLR